MDNDNTSKQIRPLNHLHRRVTFVWIVHMTISHIWKGLVLIRNRLYTLVRWTGLKSIRMHRADGIFEVQIHFFVYLRLLKPQSKRRKKFAILDGNRWMRSSLNIGHLNAGECFPLVSVHVWQIHIVGFKYAAIVGNSVCPNFAYLKYVNCIQHFWICLNYCVYLFTVK